MKTRFLSLDEYTKLATRTALHFGIKPTDEVIHLMVNYLCKADISYDESKNTSLSTYRYGACKFAAAKYFQAIKQRNLRREISISSFEDSDNILLESLTNGQSTLDEVEQAEELTLSVNSVKNLVDMMLNRSALTQSEKFCVTEHYLHGKTLVEIAEIKGVSKQAVSQSVQKALNKMREFHDKMA